MIKYNLDDELLLVHTEMVHLHHEDELVELLCTIKAKLPYTID